MFVYFFGAILFDDPFLARCCCNVLYAKLTVVLVLQTGKQGHNSLCCWSSSVAVAAGMCPNAWLRFFGEPLGFWCRCDTYGPIEATMQHQAAETDRKAALKSTCGIRQQIKAALLGS
eukprot:4376222-Amphidinium_carterae.1